MRRAIAAVACVTASACSVMSMDRAPSTPPPAGVPIRCSDTAFYPITDLAIAGGWTLASVAIVKADFGDEGDGAGAGPNAAESTLKGMLWLTVPFAVVHAVSAAAGFRWASQCRAAVADRAATPVPAPPQPPDPWSAPAP